MNWFIFGFILVLVVEWIIGIGKDGGETREDYEDVIVPFLPQTFNTYNKKGKRK
jgi:hypothetical protein